MSDLRFSCPHCLQHILCDAGYAAREITCPNCRALLRIPRKEDPSHELAEATLLKAPPPSTGPIKKPAATPAPATPNPPLPTAKSAQPTQRGKGDVSGKVPPVTRPAGTSAKAPPKAPQPVKPNRGEPKTLTVRCVCPVCESELRISSEDTESRPGQPPSKAELVRRGKTAKRSEPGSSDNPLVTHPQANPRKLLPDGRAGR
jgi:hypothetical protein